MSLFKFKISLFFPYKMPEGEKLSFPSEIHLFSWTFPIISINSLSPLGIQQSIACFQSEVSGNTQAKKISLFTQCVSEMLIAFLLSNEV